MAKKSAHKSSKNQYKPLKPEQSENKEEDNLERAENKKASIFEVFISTKTFIITHILLLIFGLGIFLGLAYYLNGSFLICCKQSEFEKYIPVTKKPSSLSLNLTNPDEELLVFNKSLIVSGSTSENTTVIIANVTTKQTIGVETNQKGDFSKVVYLDKGLNELIVAAFDLQGNFKTEERTIFYAEEKL